MKPLRLQEISRVLDVHPSGAENPQVECVCTDSRQMSPGALFFAIRGETFDGAQFLHQAAAGGAVAAVAESRPKHSLGILLICVEDARKAMGKLAAFVRSRLGGKIIAVVGSNGKTSTKRMIDAALTGPLVGSASPKSFNNDIGVPLAIFAAEPAHDYVVLELGTNHAGEIRNLARISQPDIAVIANCSSEHLEGLGDVAGVRRENCSVIESLRPDGTLIVNGDDPELLRDVQNWTGKRITFGLEARNDLFATNILCREDGTRFYLNGGSTSVAVPILGRHSAVNALAAIAVGRAMGLADSEIFSGLSRATAAEMRLELRKFGQVRVLNDAYNANPASMRAALQTLFDLPGRGRRIAVLGDMRELGSTSVESHRQLGRTIAREFPPEILICVGEEAQIIASEAQACGFPSDRVEIFRDANMATASATIVSLRDGDLVLLKASRAIGLETIARAIAEQPQSKVA